jgi:hypothetical protein
MTPDDLERALDAARQELNAASKALAPRHKGGEWERFHKAYDDCIALERELARSLGEECAVEVDWPAPWDVGAPLPYVVASSAKTFVVYHQRERDPNWDGSYATMIDPAAPEQRLIAVVEFQRCLIHKFGSPNDEALRGHRLHGRGLVAYRAHTVERSRWLEEQEHINSVHPQHRPEAFRELVHYVLAFHDETFECLAKGYVLRESLSTFAGALERCARDILI